MLGYRPLDPFGSGAAGRLWRSLRAASARCARQARLHATALSWTRGDPEPQMRNRGFSKGAEFELDLTKQFVS